MVGAPKVGRVPDKQRATMIVPNKRTCTTNTKPIWPRPLSKKFGSVVLMSCPSDSHSSVTCRIISSTVTIMKLKMNTEVLSSMATASVAACRLAGAGHKGGASCEGGGAGAG
jgi:hypothetical protein